VIEDNGTEPSKQVAQTKKRAHQAVVEESEVEDVTDAVLKRLRVNHKGSTKGQGDQMTQRSLDFYKWRRLDEKEKLEHLQKDFAKIRDDAEAFRMEEKERHALKKQHSRDMARDRQQRHRDRVKARKAANAGKLVSATSR